MREIVCRIKWNTARSIRTTQQQSHAATQRPDRMPSRKSPSMRAPPSASRRRFDQASGYVNSDCYRQRTRQAVQRTIAPTHAPTAWRYRPPISTSYAASNHKRQKPLRTPDTRHPATQAAAPQTFPPRKNRSAGKMPPATSAQWEQRTGTSAAGVTAINSRLQGQHRPG